MTRINIGVFAKELSRQHLLAEHREIVRIPNNIKKGKAIVKNIPDKFKLGKGHVKFFYNKLKYLHKRYEEIYSECVLRGYNVTYFGNSFNDLPIELYDDYDVKQEDILLVKERILLRSKVK